jgi:phosphopantothenoylcysteine decarboxylase/phosphopantothenate--cysteine ligase
MAPAMNVRMWTHPATQRNLATLQGDGVLFVGPDEGVMACGEFGHGRMAEPQAIFDAIAAALRPADLPLKGRRALVTAGPTVEAIDPVRSLTNHSSGKQGYAIAAALAALGAEVTLVSGPTALPSPKGVTHIGIRSAVQMLANCQAALPVDIAVMVAAVADWRPDVAASWKLKKGAQAPEPIKLVENPDILARISQAELDRPRLVVGFAAETNDVEANARSKLERKGCDWIVANDVTQPGVMGGEENEVLLVKAEGVDRWPRMSKEAVAARLAAEIAKAIGEG